MVYFKPPFSFADRGGALPTPAATLHPAAALQRVAGACQPTPLPQAGLADLPGTPVDTASAAQDTAPWADAAFFAPGGVLAASNPQEAEAHSHIFQLVFRWNLAEHGAIGTYIPYRLAKLMVVTSLDARFTERQIHAAINLTRQLRPGDYPYSWRDVFRLFLEKYEPQGAFNAFANYEAIYRLQGGTQWPERLAQAGRIAASIARSRAERAMPHLAGFTPPYPADSLPPPPATTGEGDKIYPADPMLLISGTEVWMSPSQAKIVFEMFHLYIADAIVGQWTDANGPLILYCQHRLKKHYPPDCIHCTNTTRSIRFAANTREKAEGIQIPRDWKALYALRAKENNDDLEKIAAAMARYETIYRDYGGRSKWHVMLNNLRCKYFQLPLTPTGERVPAAQALAPTRRNRPGAGRPQKRPVSPGGNHAMPNPGKISRKKVQTSQADESEGAGPTLQS